MGHEYIPNFLIGKICVTYMLLLGQTLQVMNCFNALFGQQFEQNTFLPTKFSDGIVQAIKLIERFYGIMALKKRIAMDWKNR